MAIAWGWGRAVRSMARGISAGLTLGALLLPALTAQVAQAAGGNQIVVISNDRGGLIGQRSKEVRALRDGGQVVELRGKCISACTMYLALPKACVSRSAVFGFHGPSWYGRPLSEAEFEHWSQLMANHYREPLRSWYLKTARYRINGYYTLSGAELVRMGYAPC